MERQEALLMLATASLVRGHLKEELARGGDSMKGRRVLWGVIILVAATLLIPGYFIARTYGLFQNEVVLITAGR